MGQFMKFVPKRDLATRHRDNTLETQLLYYRVYISSRKVVLLFAFCGNNETICVLVDASRR